MPNSRPAHVTEWDIPLPPMTLGLDTLWELADRMAADMNQHATVLIETGEKSYMGDPALRVLPRGERVDLGSRRAGIRVFATDGLTLSNGVPSLSSEEPVMSADFPLDR